MHIMVTQPEQMFITPRFSRLASYISWLTIFRWLLVGCQAVTLVVTWPLWQVRTMPPMLPAVSLPSFDMGWLLLASLAVILVRPRVGLILNSLIFIYAILIDQTRLQPEVVSLLLLMWGTLGDASALAVGRGHLIALWIWAGANKLLSPLFMQSTAGWMLDGLLPSAPDWLRVNAGYLIGGAELAVGVLAIFPRTRRLAGVIAFGLHTGILLTLSPLGHNYNPAVWAWNFGLALAGLAFIGSWREPMIGSLKVCKRWVVVLVLFLLVSPFGFYVGLLDAYLSHNLYSSNVPQAQTTALDPGITWQLLNVPLPPERRLFEAFFRQTCKVGDVMVIRDTRWWFVQQDAGFTRLVCK